MAVKRSMRAVTADEADAVRREAEASTLARKWKRRGIVGVLILRRAAEIVQKDLKGEDE